MSRRDNAANRCRGCAMHLSLCVCEALRPIAVTTRLSLVMHCAEVRKTTNTGRLALRCLCDSELTIHGRAGEPAAPPPARGFRDLLLFPETGAEELTAAHGTRGPVRLFVPDGTWRQAAKMTRRIAWLATLPRVAVPVGEASRYKLRSESKHGGLATLEAIARAYGLLEGPAVQRQLEEVFRRVVDRTLFSRGVLEAERVFGGIPDGVMRHDPRSG